MSDGVMNIDELTFDIAAIDEKQKAAKTAGVGKSYRSYVHRNWVALLQREHSDAHYVHSIHQ